METTGRTGRAVWCGVVAAVALFMMASQTLGADGTWTNLVGGTWGTAGNWSGGVIANGTDAVADFSALNLTANAFINNDASRTVGTLRFGDTAPSHNWTVTNSTLTLATGSGSPSITVSNQTATIACGLLGTQGFIKSGAGTFILGGGITNNFSGAIGVSNGVLATANSSALKNVTGVISVAAGASFFANGNFDAYVITNAINLSGGGNGAYGALNGYYNMNMKGPITLLTDTKITHDWNYFSIQGPIVASGSGKNLEMYVSTAAQYPIYIYGSMTLGTGALTLNSVPGGGIGGGESCAFDLKAANSYSGGTVLTNSATLRLGNAGALGSGGVTLYQSSWINLNALSVSILSLSGTGGSITDQGIASGTSTLTVNQAAATLFSGVISNGTNRVVALVKSGVGTLTLSGTNTYTGATAVNAGRLTGVTGGACANSALTVANGATNGVQAKAYGGQWACAGLTHNAGSTTLDFDFGGVPPSGSVAPLRVNGDLAFNGSVGFVIRSGVWLNAGTYPLVSYSGTLSGSVPGAPAALPSGLAATLVNDTGLKRIDLAVTAVPAFVASTVSAWTNLVGGNASGTWGSSANWSNGIPNGVDAVADFTALNITAHSAVTNEAPRTVGKLSFGDAVPSSNSWLLDGGLNNHLTLATSVGLPEISVTNVQAVVGGLSGTAGFVKSGNGTLVLCGTNYGNSVTGPVIVNAGLLATMNDKSFQGIVGDVLVAPGAVFQADGNFTGVPLVNNFFLSGTGGTPNGYVAGVSTPDGPLNADTGPFGALDLYGNVTLNGTITLNTDAKITHGYNNSNLKGPIVADAPGRNLELATTASFGGASYPLWVEGGIQLGTGVLTINSVPGGGSGYPGVPTAFAVDISSANTSSGGTVLTNYASLRLRHPAALGSGGLALYGNSILNLNSNSVTLAYLTGTGGKIMDDLSFAGTTTLTVNQSVSTEFGGVISNGASRLIALIKTGTGMLTLSGTNLYTGATIISNGTLGVSGSLATPSVTVCAYAAFAAGGTGTVGCAAIAGTVTFQNNGRLLVDVSKSVSDAVAVSGDVVVGNGVELRASGDQEHSGSWKLVEAAGTVQGSDFVLVGGKHGAYLTRTANAVWLRIPPRGTAILVH